MKKYLIRIGIAILTLNVGIAIFYLSSFHWISVTTQNNQNSIVGNVSEESTTTEKIDVWKLPSNFPKLKQGEFFYVGHGCGNGYIDGWLAYDDSHLSEGFNKIKPSDFKKVLENTEILESVENFKNKYGEKGLRIVLKGQNKETGKDYYEIIWYKKNKGMYHLSGPNLAIAIELEKYLYKNAK